MFLLNLRVIEDNLISLTVLTDLLTVQKVGGKVGSSDGYHGAEKITLTEYYPLI